VASFGHLGSISQAETHTGFSFFSKVETIAEFRDELIFSSTDPAATFADVSPRLLLHGILDAAASAGFGSAEMVGEVTLDGQFFAFRLRNDSVNGFSIIQNNFSVTGTVGPTTDAVFTTPLIRVGLHTPVSFDLFMSTDAVAGSFGSAASDFGGSFKFVTGSDAFNVPDGVTVNAGSWLVDNRFVDPLSAVPEPASWALMILGFGVLGAGLRVQRAINPKGEWA
jgi:hypothetical protein